MDPVAASTEMAVRDLGVEACAKSARGGRASFRRDCRRAICAEIANRVLANGVIESVYFEPYCPERFETGRENAFQIRRVKIRDLTEAQLAALSREGHLFLSLEEMKAIQNYFRGQEREPTDIELESLAQTWSEHCVHKTLEERGGGGSPRWFGREDRVAAVWESHQGNDLRQHDGDHEGGDHEGGRSVRSVLSFGVRGQRGRGGVRRDGRRLFQGGDAQPSQRDRAIRRQRHGGGRSHPRRAGTGLAAKPVANTDVFCVAFPDTDRGTIPKGVIHPKRILQQVVAGVRDYGNRMGIPTVNGAVYFDDRYLGNPLVFCGCVGLIPRDKIRKAAGDGDAIVLLGGRTGRDGIHGATFSSAELTDTHADEFSHAVQIGNAITEKKMADVILAARDRNLFTAVTDCGAGGLSSAIGEMGEDIGATVELEKVPLKYAGLRYDEIWISEAQERMVLAVPQGKRRRDFEPRPR